MWYLPPTVSRANKPTVVATASQLNCGSAPKPYEQSNQLSNEVSHGALVGSIATCWTLPGLQKNLKNCCYSKMKGLLALILCTLGLEVEPLKLRAAMSDTRRPEPKRPWCYAQQTTRKAASLIIVRASNCSN